MKKRIWGTLLAAAMTVGSGAAHAGYPDKAVRIVVPFAAGGGVDALARPFAKELGDILGQSIVVENKPSNTGQIGATDVARAAADGYTLLLSSAAFATTPAFYPQVPYDPVKDFSPVMIMAAAPQVLVASNRFKAASLPDVLAQARQSDRINFALSASTGIQALATAMLAGQGGVTFMTIPYKGAGAAFMDLISGEVDLMIDNPASSLVHVRAGKLRVLATTGSKRMAILPDVPTVAETLPGFEARNWFVLAAPQGTPPAVIQKLNEASARALNTPAMRQMLERDGIDLVADSPAHAAAFLQDEIAKWGKVVKEGNLQP
ncbi:lipoprotein [Bordetella pertussis]|uniref:Exported protein n=7 Tax=Bordetella TaxID=517 RepID=Q7W0B2_BORPE|nr:MULTISPECIES: tripartite tricarboxylate transporter substrate binding protein [Bordetella]ETH37899.1 tripartite tricarboxylate transporter family receptor [Bordetella pertussis H918]ETH41691.1 tripartite tricarboxylate transporter family receptor [Bordetella pertussis H939]ETH46809.1 tripartite tricarboxylate transporter family receptor [Bordetella pertussis H921]ETH70787.1 tripartite tricarboxylate transporter family receptor [Bordetella pertussis STO1-CHLA-0011]ETH83186.1 tripartite trica